MAIFPFQGEVYEKIRVFFCRRLCNLCRQDGSMGDFESKTPNLAFLFVKFCSI